MCDGKLNEFNVDGGNWSLYIERFEIYCGEKRICKERRLSALIDAMGDEAYELLCIISCPDKPSNLNYSDVVKIMSEYLPTTSVIVERHRFRNRKQQVGETVLQYLSELKRLSKHCDFKRALEENLRDQFVCGLHEGIRQKLLVQQNLKYRDIVNFACAIEKEEDSLLTKDLKHLNLDGVKLNETPRNAQNLQVPKTEPNEQLFSSLSTSQRELREKIIREEELTIEDIVKGLQDPDLVTMSFAAREARRKMQKDFSTVKSMIEAGIVNPLVKALDKNDCPILQYEATWAIVDIAAKHHNTKALVDAGVIPKLISLVARGEVLGEKALEALDIITGPHTRDAMLNNGILRVLLPGMKPDTPINVLKKTVGMFRLLCRKKSPIELKYVAPALPHICELLIVTDVEVLCNITEVLCNLLECGVEFIEEAQNTPKLLYRLVALLDHDSYKVKLPTVYAVEAMLKGATDSQRDRCLEAGYLPRLVALLDSDNSWLVLCAMSAISCVLSGTEEQIQRAIMSGVLTHIQRLLKTQGIEARSASAISILCRSTSRKHTDALLKSGCLEPFCALLSNHMVASNVLDGLHSLIEAGEKNGLRDDIVLKLKDIGVLERLNKLKENVWLNMSSKALSLIEKLQPLTQTDKVTRNENSDLL